MGRFYPAKHRLLYTVLVVLIVVLGILVWSLLRNPDTSPIDPDVGPVPKPLFSISGPGKGDAPRFIRPLSAAWASNGDIYVSDTGNARICVFSSRGRFLREFGHTTPSKRGAEVVVLEQPAGIAVAADGTVYVADVRGGAVVVYDARGSFVKRFGPDTSAGASKRDWTPTDVAVSGGDVYVTDAKGLAVFSADGVFKGRVDNASDGVPFAHPNGVALRPGGVAVSDTNNGRVVSVDGTGSLVWVAGPSDARQRTIGLPRGLSVAKDGTTLVADAFLFGIARLSDQGVLLERYGERGAELGRFEFPNDVDVRGDLIVVADKENNRVQVIRWPGLVGLPSN